MWPWLAWIVLSRQGWPWTCSNLLAFGSWMLDLYMGTTMPGTGDASWRNVLTEIISVTQNNVWTSLETVYHITWGGLTARQVKAHLPLSLVTGVQCPRPVRWKEKSGSCNLSSDVHTVAHAPTQISTRKIDILVFIRTTCQYETVAMLTQNKARLSFFHFLWDSPTDSAAHCSVLGQSADKEHNKGLLCQRSLHRTGTRQNGMED